jgi:hypothetical protein
VKKHAMVERHVHLISFILLVRRLEVIRGVIFAVHSGACETESIRSGDARWCRSDFILFAFFTAFDCYRFRGFPWYFMAFAADEVQWLTSASQCVLKNGSVQPAATCTRWWLHRT